MTPDALMQAVKRLSMRSITKVFGQSPLDRRAAGVARFESSTCAWEHLNE
jgi:hypothetical protein